MVLLLSSSSQSTSTVCRSRASSFKSVAQRPVARVRVSTDTQTETETSAPNSVPAVDSPTVPAVDFTPNTQAATGYVEFDTAGQSNMYPVVTKAFEVGSDQDTLQTSSANLIVGVGAGVLAVGVLTVGLFALSQQGSVSADPVGDFKSLTEYAAAFSAEL